MDTEPTSRKFIRPANDPKLISATIGPAPPKPTAELYAEKMSRFES